MPAPLPLPPLLGGARIEQGPDLREVTDGAHRAAGELLRAGAAEGTRVALDPATGAVDRLRWLLGADLLGAATLITDSSWSGHDLRRVLREARPDVRVGGSPTRRPGHVRPASGGGTVFYLPTSSGSSGRPKVLARSRRSWWESFRVFDIGIGAGDTVLVPGPLSSSLFLFAAVHALRQGARLRLLERWSAVEAAETAAHSTVVHLVPPMLAELLTVLERSPELRDRCELRTVVCGGARLDEALRERLRTVLPGCEPVEYYGSAEHSLVALRHGDRPLRPVPGVRVQVRDGTRVLGAGEPGTLWVRSTQSFEGYLESGTLAAAPAGFSCLGDRGTPAADGSLTVHGRAGTTFTSGATTVAVERVEEVLRGAAGVLDLVVTPTPHPRLGSLVTAVVETEPTAAPRLAALRRRAREMLAPAERPRRWLRTTAIPRTASGKPARAVLAEQLADGSLPVEVLC